jgi:hypothetical protein
MRKVPQLALVAKMSVLMEQLREIIREREGALGHA